MSTTVQARPVHIALASSTAYVDNSTEYGLFILGVSSSEVSPAIQAKLRRHEAWNAFPTVEAAVGELLKRIEWSMELHGRRAESRARLLAGMSAILDIDAPLLNWRDTRQRIAVMRDRLADRVERDRAVGSVPKSIQLDAGQQRIASLEKQVAELQAQLQQLTSATPASAY